jgi:hypothetical protein
MRDAAIPERPENVFRAPRGRHGIALAMPRDDGSRVREPNGARAAIEVVVAAHVTAD